jgi:hypothetical protein
MKKGGENDYRSTVDRNDTFGTLAYPNRSLIPHTHGNTVSSYGSLGAIGRNSVVDRKITRMKKRANPRLETFLRF